MEQTATRMIGRYAEFMATSAKIAVVETPAARHAQAAQQEVLAGPDAAGIRTTVASGYRTMIAVALLEQNRMEVPTHLPMLLPAKVSFAKETAVVQNQTGAAGRGGMSTAVQSYQLVEVVVHLVVRCLAECRSEKVEGSCYVMVVRN